MKNKNRTGRQKYIPSDRKCKNCVYNGGKRKGERVCLADARTVQSIPSRATQAILAEPKHTLSEALLSTDTVFRHIKKRWLLD